MAKKTGIQIFGLKETKEFLNQASREKKNNVNNIIHQQGFKLEAEVKNSIAGRRAEPTSVDTGRFLNSINTDNSDFLRSEVKTDIPYAPFLEKGTRFIKARRHFEFSGDRKRKEIVSAVQKALK